MKKHLLLITLLVTFVTFLEAQEENTLYLFNGKSIEIESLNFSNNQSIFINDRPFGASSIKFINFEGKLIANLLGSHRIITEPYFSESTISGKINFFEARTKTTSLTSTVIFGKGYLQFFNSGFGNIKEANFKNLKPILISNAKSFKYLKKANTNRILDQVFLYSGMGLSLAGFVVAVSGLTELNHPTKKANNTPFIIGGSLIGGGFSISFATLAFKKPKYKNTRLAIETFNQ